jgi:large subunit ribosomal protein L18e
VEILIMKKNLKTNPEVTNLINDLKKLSWDKKAPIWRDIAKRLEKPRSSWSEVNLSRIARNTKKNDIIIVPGKVLASGDISIPVTVAAFHFSDKARTRINGAGGKDISIMELARKHPKGTGIKIIG